MWPFGRKKPPEGEAAPAAAAPGQPGVPAGVVPEAPPKKKTWRERRNEWRQKIEAFRSRQQVKRGLPPEPVAELKIRLGTPSTIYTVLVALTIVFYCLGAYPWIRQADDFYGIVRDPYAPKLDPVVQETQGDGAANTPAPGTNIDAQVPTTQPGPASREGVGGGPVPPPPPGPTPPAPPAPR
ncbi:MAG: hypothetical protein AAB215_02575 [Planctomycetota bacterium]